MDYQLSEEQRLLQELAQQIARERIKPVRAYLDEEEIFPTDLMQDLAQADLFGGYHPGRIRRAGVGLFRELPGLGWP